MDGRIPPTSRVISPLQFSTIGIANGLDFGSANLFPSLAPVEDNTGAIDGLPSHAGSTGEISKTEDLDIQDDKADRVLIEATKIILQEQQSPVHIKDIIERLQRKGCTSSSNILLENLESTLEREAAKSGSEIRRCQQHWFTVKNAKLPTQQRVGSREANNIKYRRKYWRLKKLIKRIVFENAAIADEIIRTDAKFQRVKVERKFLLKRLLEYQAMCHEPVQPVRVVPPPPPPPSSPPPETVDDPPPTSPSPVVEPPPKPKTTKVRTKKSASGKTKKEADSAVPTKPSPEDKKTSEGDAATVSQDGKSDPPVKPKRKKPGTAIKRRVQPIPVDSKGKPVFPIVLGGLTVHSLGDIVWDRPGFHSERYIWPVGFCSSRFYPSMKTPDKKCIYTCKILDGGYGPTFVMSPEDDSDNSIEASSATACHCVVLKAINKARGKEATNTGSGPEFFGFSHPTIQYLLQSLPNARKCSKYQWVKFELPKGKTTGKLGSNVLPADELVEMDDPQDRASTSFDANEMFKDDSMDGSSSSAMHALTFTSTASNITQLPSPGFESGMLGYQLKPTSGDPSLDLGTPISPPQSSLSSPLHLSPKINTNSMSPSATSQPTFLIQPSPPLFSFDDAGLPD